MPMQSPELSTRLAQAGQPRRNASEPLLVGIDLGTTTCKAVVVSAGGAELAHGAAERALARTPDGPVLAVGVTSMAETCALLGADGEPVAPAIAWHDLRGQDEAAALASGLGADRFAVRVGLPASALCTLAKYRWLRRHLPAALQGTRLLSVAEWVVHRLGGEQLAELSLASRTGALDRDAGDWWDEALAWAGGPAGLLPPVAPAGTPAGRAGRRGGRLDGAVLAVAGHDHLCAAVGAGAAEPGELFDSCGTAEALVRAVPPPVEADRVRTAVAGHVTVGWHVVPGLQALLGAQRAGLVLQRFLDLLGVAPERVEELEAAAVATPPGADGLTIEQAETDRAVLRGIGRHPSPGLLWRPAAGRAARPCERSRPSGSASSNTRRWSKPARAVPPWWPAAPPVCTARWPPCPDPGASPHSTKGTLDDRATPRGARYREAVRARPRTTECRLRRLRRGGDRPDRRQRRG